jgi:hypothetical protein
MLCARARRNSDPVGPIRARRRPEARAAHDGRDRRGRDPDPQLRQLALERHIAAARVLSHQPSDQVARLGRTRRAAGPAPAAAPTSLKECPVPAAERPRADRTAGRSPGREQAANRSQQGPVDGRVPGPLPAAPEDRQPVAQHHDLKLPRTTTAGEHAHEAAPEPVQQTHPHDAQPQPVRPRPPTRPSRPGIEFLYPTGVRQASRQLRCGLYGTDRAISTSGRVSGTDASDRTSLERQTRTASGVTTRPRGRRNRRSAHRVR